MGETEEILFDTKSLFESDEDGSISYRELPTSSCSIDENLQDIDMDDKTAQIHLQAMEIVIQNLGIIRERELLKKTKKPPKNQIKWKTNHYDVDYSMETPIDINCYTSSLDVKKIANIPMNQLGPREQEEADEPVRKGMRCLFDNKFLKAKSLFQTKASSDPLYIFGLGIMAFMKAMMTENQDETQLAMNIFLIAYSVASAQIDNSTTKKSFWPFSFSSLITSNHTGLPNNPPIHQNTAPGETPSFIPNGVLRANVIKAECCLFIGMLQITQETIMSYIKCGLNLKKAFTCYTIVWQEYKRMGQRYTKYMDRNTISAIQFGLGSVHLLLSVLPPKVLKVISSLGFKSDKQLGFALLKLCVEGKGVRSPLASLMLLSYYSLLSSFVPQLHALEFKSASVECLRDAQKSYPSSCLFLYYAARISRVTKNLVLSTQSFTFAVDACRNEWMDTAMTQIGYYEIGFNFALQLDWQSALGYFEKLSQEKYYWSPALCQYFIGACYGMLGQQTESILAFALVPQFVKDQKKRSCIDNYVKQKVEFFQKSGYQDLDFSLPALELLLVWNAFDQMEKGTLEACLVLVQNTLELTCEREKLEYAVRLVELVPSTKPSGFYNQRAILMLMKAAILNALGQHEDSISHLNWVMDHKHQLCSETWIVPFTYWEAGITSWGLGNFSKSRTCWEKALTFTKYTFEYRMAIRLSLALSKCDQVGATVLKQKKESGISTQGKKRMPVA
ncbi:uncharacterized protein B0P05DRAFT_527859 [Gilbertella persicaria]|uniref:uncharacterized protein n=1 Tax=Gilbertella persicaria TaxID=101096 RepID=UPI002220D959|nr:uncharacterized protein B0P05DRAFT_527859 [Gilbertella persicaria]KAI8090899.1 hypothetical protein B0P05DRAFT_527859 [Gilbertella persicaria]